MSEAARRRGSAVRASLQLASHALMLLHTSVLSWLVNVPILDHNLEVVHYKS